MTNITRQNLILQKTRTCYGGRVVNFCTKLKPTEADNEQLDDDRPEPSEIEAFGNYFAEAFRRPIRLE